MFLCTFYGIPEYSSYCQEVRTLLGALANPPALSEAWILQPGQLQLLSTTILRRCLDGNGLLGALNSRNTANYVTYFEILSKHTYTRYFYFLIQFQFLMNSKSSLCIK